MILVDEITLRKSRRVRRAVDGYEQPLGRLVLKAVVVHSIVGAACAGDEQPVRVTGIDELEMIARQPHVFRAAQHEPDGGARTARMVRETQTTQDEKSRALDFDAGVAGERRTEQGRRANDD